MKFYTAIKLDPNTLFDYVMNCGKFLCLLPLDSGSKFTLKVLNGVGCFIITINIIGFLLSMLSTIFINFHDRILVVDNLGIVTAVLELFLNILFWRIKRVEFQEFSQEFKNFLTTSKEHEKKIIDKYFNRYKYFYTFLIIFVSGITILRVIFVPIQQKQEIPFPFYYPFIIKSYSATHFLIFLSQSIVSFYIGYQTIFAIATAMIFKHAAIKLELLVYDLKGIKIYSQLKIWIQQHLECIQFVDHINQVLSSLLMKTYILAGLSIIFRSIKLIYIPDSSTTPGTFLTIISFLMGTYIFNGPADDIYEMSEVIRFTLYDIEWNKESIEMRKAIIIIMSRVQKPLFISPLKGLMPALNRKIYTNFLSYLVSYIMTLRAIVSEL